MSDQAERLRELVREVELAPSGCRVVAVTGGKGGTGKSNIAVNLSIGLAERGLRTLLVDLDLGLANADILLGIDAGRNLAHCILRRLPLAEAVVQVGENLRFLPGASGVPKLADLAESERERILTELEALEQSVDCIVVDTGAGVHRNVLDFACAADDVLVVTTPEPTSVMDAFATIKMIAKRRLPERLRVVVNQARDRGEALATAEKIVGVSRQILKVRVEKMGYVLADYHLQEAVRRRRPVVWDAPNALASQCLRTLAGLLAGRREEAPAAARASGFFRRIAAAWQHGSRR